jgi:PAS domain S-box-containing protein
MAWLGLLLPAALSWWWVNREPKVRAEAAVAETLGAARNRTQAIEDRFNSLRRLVADLAEEPALVAALAAPPGTPAPAAARQLNLVAKASGASIGRIELFDNGGLTRLGWEYEHVLDDYRPLKPRESARLDLLYVQAGLRSPRGATWIGASEPEGAENLVLKPESPVVPTAYIAVPVYGASPAPEGVLAIKVRVDAEDFLGPGNKEPWMLLGEQGEIIFRPATATDWIRYLPSARRLQGFEEAFGRPVQDLAGESGALAVRDGLLCYRRIHVDHRRDWILLRPFEKEALFAVGQETLTQLYVLWALSLLLLGLGWWVLQRRELTHAQEAHHQLLQAILNASKDLAIFATGPDGLIRFFNAGAERMLGFAADEAIGRFTMKDFHVPEEVPDAAEAYQVSGEHGSQTLEGVSLQRPGGRRTWTYRDVADRHFPVFLSITALRGRAGGTLCHVVVAQDARPVLERERKLEEAAFNAKEAERLKSTFLAVMSHEVRTPMNAIMGMVRVLKRTALDPEQREITDVGERAAKNLLELLDGVLDYTKLEAGRMEIDSTPFAPHALTAECAELWRLQAASKGLGFEFQSPDRVPLALGDPARLRQILNNLLGNAVKFTDTGRVTLRLRVEAAGERIALRWEVEDTGPGIAPEERERIFEPFTQAEGETTRRHGGTGIGLALCRELARLMHGSLRAEGEPGQGSRFSLDLELPAAETPKA